MYKFRNSAVGVLGVLLMITVCTAALPFVGYNLTGPIVGAAPAPTTQNVKVVNTSQEPAQVSGNVQAQQSGPWSVGINGTPTVGIDGTFNTVKLAAGTTVQAQQGGDWSVNIDPSGNTVKIDSAAPVAVRDVDNPARQPFFYSGYQGFSDGAQSSNPFSLPPVPAGKILVVEYINFRGRMLIGQKMVEAILSISPPFTSIDFPISSSGGDGIRDNYVVSQPLRLYAPAGTVLTTYAVRNNATGGNPDSVAIAVSGYLLDER